jgi:hypothetical protein
MKVHLVELCISETISLQDWTYELRSAYFLNMFASLSTPQSVLFLNFNTGRFTVKYWAHKKNNTRLFNV